MGKLRNSHSKALRSEVQIRNPGRQGPQSNSEISPDTEKQE